MEICERTVAALIFRPNKNKIANKYSPIEPRSNRAVGNWEVRI